MKNSVSIALKSFSQIILQENQLTDFLLLIGLAIGNWQYAVAGLIAVLAGNFWAFLLKFDENNLKIGFYGFSSALVGIALLYCFESSMLIWLLVIIGGILASCLQHSFYRMKIRSFTFPFVLIIWVFYFIISTFQLATPSTIVQWKGLVTNYPL